MEKRYTVKNFRVPGHDVKVNISELLFINTETFQRLNNIKQLGLAHFVYPFALHTRASHCIDCLFLAQKFIDQLEINVKNSTLNDVEKQAALERLSKDVATIKATAILHDIMHIPYAHTLEDENGILPKGDKHVRINKMIRRLEKELMEFKYPEDDFSRLSNYRIFSFLNPREFQEALNSAISILKEVRKTLWTIALHDHIEELIKAKISEGLIPKKKIFENVKTIVEEESTKKMGEKIEILSADRYYIADIIGNTISVDLISYILRDAEFTGIETKPGGWYRIFDYLCIMRDNVGKNRLVIKLTKKGEWRQDVFSTIIRILNARYDLTEQVTYHHAKLSASAMLGKLSLLCGVSEGERLYTIGDEGFFSLLESCIEKLSDPRIKNGAKKIIKSLKSRRLHKRFHVVTKRIHDEIDLSKKYGTPEERWAFEKEIEDRYNLPPGSIILFCLTKKMMKEAAALVVYEKRKFDGTLESQVRPLNSKDCMDFLDDEKHSSTLQRVKNVQEQYEALWKLYVFTDPSIIPLYGREIKEILNQKLGVSKRFDFSNLDLMEDYKLSEEISEKITKMKPPETDREKIYQHLPLAIAEASGRGEKVNINSIRGKLDLVISSAIDRANNIKKRKTLVEQKRF